MGKDETEKAEQAEEAEMTEDSEKSERKMYKAVCSDCGAECEVPFEPTEGKPVRCQECFRKNRPRRFGGNRNRFNNRRPREMHDAVCAECKKKCQVPFKPSGEKPVLCGDCYRKTKGFD